MTSNRSIKVSLATPISSVAQEKERNTSIDLMRLIAAFGVISLHLPEGTHTGKWLSDIFWPLCVPFFYVVSLTYFVAGLKSSGIGTSLARSWNRIIVPYLVWTGIYILLFMVKSMVANTTAHFISWRVLLYGESAVHLYFIPTLVFMQVTVAGIYQLINRKLKSAFIILLISTVYFYIGQLYECFGLATPGHLLGTAFYVIVAFMAGPYISRLKIRPALVTTGIIMISIAIFNSFRGEFLLFYRYPVILPMGGIGLLLIAMGYPQVRASKHLLQIAAASYGIYLCHILFLEGLELIFDRLWSGTVVYDFKFKVLEVCTIFLLSIAFVYTIRLNSTLRQWLLGEKSLRTSKMDNL